MKTLKQLINEIWPHPYSIEHGDMSEEEIGKVDNFDDYDPKSEENVGEGVKKLHATLHEHMPLSTDDMHTVGRYTENSSRYNSRLYKEHTKQIIQPWEYTYDHEKVVHSMDDITSLHRTPHDMHVYTGVHFNPHKYKEENKNKIEVHLPAFTSTSIHPHIAVGFAHSGYDSDDDHVLKIHVPQGSRGAYFGKHSDYPQEKEFVLPRNSKVHIHPEPEIVNDPRNPLSSKKFAVWHARLVHDGTENTRHMEEKNENL